MWQEIVRIPLPGFLQPYFHGTHLPIFGYGLMLVVAFLAAVQLGKWIARRVDLDPEVFVNAGLIALAFGVIGARASHVLENLPDYTRPDLSIVENLRNMINIREGGLTYYGGFLLSTPACLIYAAKKGVPVRLGMDIVAPCLMIGLGLGRVGCFLNGCCYGAETNLSWGVRFPYYSNAYIEQFRDGEIEVPAELKRATPDGFQLLKADEVRDSGDAHLKALAASQWSKPVQPTELYTTVACLLLAGVLLAYFSTPHWDGRVFALMLMCEGTARFLEELIRVEPPVIDRWVGRLHVSMSLSMILGVGMVIVGGAFWYATARFRPTWRVPEESASGTPASGAPAVAV